MSPEKPSEQQLPHGAGPELHKLTADADDLMRRMDDEIGQIEAGIQKIEQVEQELRRKGAM